MIRLELCLFYRNYGLEPSNNVDAGNYSACLNNNGEWMDNKEYGVKADDAEERAERKIAVDLYITWMIFIRATGVERGKRDGGRRGREDFSISICHSFFMRFLSLLILDFSSLRSSSRLFGFGHFQHSSHLSTDNHYQSTGPSVERQDFWPIHTLAYPGP